MCMGQMPPHLVNRKLMSLMNETCTCITTLDAEAAYLLVGDQFLQTKIIDGMGIINTSHIMLLSYNLLLYYMYKRTNKCFTI